MPSDIVLGIDIACRVDLPPAFPLAFGYDCLANSLARRLITPAGSLADLDPDAADYGTDMRGRINSRATPAELKRGMADAVSEVLKDERVLAAKGVSVYDVKQFSGTLELAVETTEGPFRLVLGVSELDVRALGFESVAPVQANPLAAAPIEIIPIPGPQGDPGPPGAPGGGGEGDGTAVIDDGGEYGCTSTDEVVVQSLQETFDFGAGGTFQVELAAQVSSPDESAVGTWRCRIGGTDGEPDGDLAATLTALAGSAYAKQSDTGTLAVGAGLALVKVTAQSSEGPEVLIKNITVGITRV